MSKHMPPFDPREVKLVKKLIQVSSARLFNTYRKLHPSSDRIELATDFDSDLGYSIARLKIDRPVTWIRLLADPTEEAIEEPEVIGYLGLSMRRKAMDALRDHMKRSALEAQLPQDPELAQDSPEHQTITKDMLENLMKAIAAQGLDLKVVHKVFVLQSRGHTRREIAEITGKSIHQVGRIITKVRDIVKHIQSGGD